MGIHDPDATDGREEPCGLLSTDILDADGNRDPNVDCPCSIITAGKVWRDKLPDDSLTNVADHPAKAAGGDVLVAGTASESVRNYPMPLRTFNLKITLTWSENPKEYENNIKVNWTGNGEDSAAKGQTSPFILAVSTSTNRPPRMESGILPME